MSFSMIDSSTLEPTGVVCNFICSSRANSRNLIYKVNMEISEKTIEDTVMLIQYLDTDEAIMNHLIEKGATPGDAFLLMVAARSLMDWRKKMN